MQKQIIEGEDSLISIIQKCLIKIYFNIKIKLVISKFDILNFYFNQQWINWIYLNIWRIF